MSTVELSVPLELSNLPDDLALRSEPPASVTIQVLANTAQVRFLADRKLHLWVNAASAREGHNTLPLDAASLDLPRGVQVRKINPAAVDFTTVKLAERRVPLIPTLRGALPAAYRLVSVTLEPDTVGLKGPQEALGRVSALSTLPIDLERMTEDKTLSVAPNLNLYSDIKLIAEPPEVRAVIRIEERLDTAIFTDLPVEVDLKNGQKAAGGTFSVTPQKINVSVSWPASRPRAVAADEIRVRVFVDAEALKKDRQIPSPVVVVPPNGVVVTAIDPVNVTVTSRQPRDGAPGSPSPSLP
jgi:YbbR domain-containing protein